MGTAEVHALSGVDLDLYSGELVVLLGPSGSGKTTLHKNLGGLDDPTDGELRYKDNDLTQADEAALTLYRRNTVGFIFQFYNLIPSLTARENVALITEIAEDPMDPEEALGSGEDCGSPPGPLSCAAIRRRTAARSDRAGNRQAAQSASVRRADRSTGCADRHHCFRGDSAGQ